MSKACPTCGETYGAADEFCPEDGTRLIDVSNDKKTRLGTPVAFLMTDRGRAAQQQPDLGPAPDTDPEPSPDPTPHPAPGAAYYDRMVGTVIDNRYRVGRKLGEGGMGVVFEAHHTVIGKRVAVKVLRREMTRDRSIVQRFLQEAKAASRINHEHIVDVTDFGTLPDGAAYFVMEFIEGETLQSFIDSHAPVPPERTLPIIAQLARALGAAHKKGIVHRDLKPDNIFLLTREGRSDFVKIVDFGIAKVAPDDASQRTRLTRAGTVFGTPAYMAPEQAMGQADIDHRVDIYAVGTILYEMLVGEVPHEGGSPVATLAMQMTERIKPPREARPDLGISDELEEVIMTALAKDRDRRYPTMQAFLAGLERSSDGVPLEMVAANSVKILAAPGYITSPPDAPTLKPNVDQGPNPFAELPSPSAWPPPPPETKPTTVTYQVTPLRRPARAPWVVIGVLAVAAIALAYVLVRKPLPPTTVATVVPTGLPDATVEAPPTAPVTEVAPDATAATPSDLDASRPVTTSTKKKRGGSTPAPTVGGTGTVIVRTQPEGGHLYLGMDPAGPDGTSFRRDTGTELVVRCFKPPHSFGSVSITVDAPRKEATCPMVSQPGKCIRDLKNPFYPCE